MSRTLAVVALAFALGWLAVRAAPVLASREMGLSQRGRMPLRLLGEPKRPAANVPESRDETVRRLQRAYEDASSKLETDDAGSVTQRLQSKIVEDLDRLIDQPPSQTNNPGAGSKPQSPKGAQGGANQPSTTRPMPGEISNRRPDAQHSGGAVAQPAPQMPGDPSRQPWIIKMPGRQQTSADAFARDHCLPQYEDLLRRYYRAIADEALRKVP